MSEKTDVIWDGMAQILKDMDTAESPDERRKAFEAGQSLEVDLIDAMNAEVATKMPQENDEPIGDCAVETKRPPSWLRRLLSFFSRGSREKPVRYTRDTRGDTALWNPETGLYDVQHFNCIKYGCASCKCPTWRKAHPENEEPGQVQRDAKPSGPTKGEMMGALQVLAPAVRADRIMGDYEPPTDEPGE